MAALTETLPPLSLSNNASCAASPHILNGTLDPLTPPATPEKLAEQRNSIDGKFEALTGRTGSISAKTSFAEEDSKSEKFEALRKPLETLPEEPQRFSKIYKIDKELGQGAWSKVYRAYEQSPRTMPPASLPPSPPTSPESKFQERQGKVIAVKVPSEKRAHKVLKEEACILTYLHSHNQASSYLVPFHGFDISTNAIIMDVIPSSLESYMKSHSHNKLTTKTMFDPIIGAQHWASLAQQLIAGLAFLQTTHCIHGDIKPANILLRSDEFTDTLTPLYCDFSSARISSASDAGSVEEITAVTKDYLSPELLHSLVSPQGPPSVATFASDVFALAVTLIAAAIGTSPYAYAPMEMQKLSMARQGMPVDFARQGDNGSRIMKGRAVAKILGPAVEKDTEKRITVTAWREVADEVLRGWEERGWANGG